MLIFSGGGAGAWAGNNVAGLCMNTATPYWTTIVNPSNVTHINPQGGATQTYYRDGKPSSRHAYQVHHYNDRLDRGYTFGGANEWTTDSAVWGNIDSYGWADQTWTANVGTVLTDGGFYRGLGDNVPVIKHPSTEDVWRFYGSGSDPRWWRLNSSNSYATFSAFNTTGAARTWGPFAVHPILNLIVGIGINTYDSPIPGYFSTTSIATGVCTKGTLSGAQAGVATGSMGHSLEWVPDWNAFAYFTDDGNLYRVDVASASSASISLVATTGTPPPVGASAGNGASGGIWTRFKYSNELKGLILMQQSHVNVRFLRTA
jgi:hypothetical protein